MAFALPTRSLRTSTVAPMRTRAVTPVVCKAQPEEKSFSEKFALPMATAALCTALLGTSMINPEEALAAKSGGRMGGSSGFKSRSAPAPSRAGPSRSGMPRSVMSAPSLTQAVPRSALTQRQSGLRAGPVAPAPSQLFSQGLRPAPMYPPSSYQLNQNSITNYNYIPAPPVQLFRRPSTQVRSTNTTVIVAPPVVAPPLFGGFGYGGGFGYHSFMPGMGMGIGFPIFGGLFQIFALLMITSVIFSVIRGVFGSKDNDSKSNKKDGDGWGDL